MRFFQNKKTGAVLTFAACMIGLTIVARIADSYMLPEVIPDKIEQKSLQYQVSISGEIKAEGEIPVYGTEELRVRDVSVEEGDLVKAGDVLFTYDMEFLNEKIEDRQKELKKLGIQYEDAQNNRQRALEKKNQSIGRADRDYNDALNAAGSEASAAYQDMETARRKYEQVCNNRPNIQDENLWDGDSGLDDGTDGGDSGLNDGSDGSADGGDSASAQQDAVMQWEAEKEAAYQEYVMRKRAYNDTLRAGAESKKSARRQAEDARDPMDADRSLELQAIDIQDLEADMQKLLQVKESGGKVCAEFDGKIIRVNLEMGSITGTEIAVVMEDFSQSFFFEGIADEKMAAHVRTGDICNIRIKDQNIFLEQQEIHKVTEIKSENPDTMQEFPAADKKYRVQVKINGEQVKQSGRAELELVTESNTYPYCVSLDALYGSDEDAYILVIKEETTTLGMQTVAVKTPVRVLEKNDAYAAVEGSIERDSKVIVRAGKTIGDGERVKVVKEK